MSRAAVFFTAVALLAVVLIFFPRGSSREGFQCASAAEAEKILVRKTEASIAEKSVNPAVAQLGVGNIAPSPIPPGDLPMAPFVVRAKGAPLPYRDPATEPAKYIRILGTLEDLQAFIGFQAQAFYNTCDPSIQLPLQTARADVSRLQNMVSVLNRNPGMTGTITNREINGILDNLNYLRDRLRVLSSSGAILGGGAMEGFEGFEDIAGQGAVEIVTGVNPTDEVAAAVQEAAAAPGVAAPSTVDVQPPPNMPPATLQQLQEFQTRLIAEKLRLGASGTTDPAIQARINSLDRIEQEIGDVIKQLREGIVAPENVPILEADLTNALPILGDVTKPLPQIVQSLNLPSAILSLFPGGLSPTNMAQLNEFNTVLKNYAHKLFNGLSWGINFNYTSENAAAAAASASQSEKDKMLMSFNGTMPAALGSAKYELHSKEGYSDSTTPSGLPGVAQPGQFPEEREGFDWKARARIINERIRSRGLNPKDFGAVNPDSVEVSKDFSWRGYTRMLCTRLLTTPDPGLPITVGCPPENWNGWTSTSGL